MKYLLITKLFLFISIHATTQEKPNILWLVCEDQSLFFPQYGDSLAKTPNINQLSNEGIVYDNFYAVSPVCAPSRSSIITGMYPTTIGTQHMRAYKKIENNKNNISHPSYSASPNKRVQFFTEILRQNGYYCTNNSKEDYNMLMSPLAWDESSRTAHWKNRKKNQPFFAVFNFSSTHESKIWGNERQHSKEEISKVKLPPFYPNNDVIKNDFVTNYKNIERLDSLIGKIIIQLKQDNLYNNTIIFFYSDHGGPFPRYKRSIYDTGIKCPLIIKWNKKPNKKRNNQMISFIDLAPTVLDLSDCNTPDNIEGISFFNQNKRKYIYAATDRFDEYTDKRRCIRSDSFKLILNCDTSSPIMKPVKYRKKMATMKLLDSLHLENKLNMSMNDWYNSFKKKYELYDIINDPNELYNLFGNKKYDTVFNELKQKLFSWKESSDFGDMNELEMIDKMLNHGMKHVLNEPELETIQNGFKIISNNLNSSVGWRKMGAEKWEIYNGNIIEPGNNFETIIFKPGYEILHKSYFKNK